MARPTRLTAETRAALCDALERGCTRKDAAALAGIAESTLFQWLAAGRDDEAHRFVELLQAVEHAEAQASQVAVGTIRTAMDKGDWKAAAWWLERRRRRTWGKPQVVRAPPGRVDLEGLEPGWAG
jgi:hypothetical protein